MKPTDEIDLGLAVLRAACPEEPMTYEDIAAYCGCSTQTIHTIAQTAFRKIRARLSPEVRDEIIRLLRG